MDSRYQVADLALTKVLGVIDINLQEKTDMHQSAGTTIPKYESTDTASTTLPEELDLQARTIRQILCRFE